MSERAKGTKPTRTPGSLEGIKPGETLDEFEKRVGDDCPELTAEDFARARPISDFPELAAAIARARAERGLDKAPTKKKPRADAN